MTQVVEGLSCPKCQGKIQIREGERIVICPYCDQRSFVKGSRGVIRYQIMRSVDYETACQSVREFWKGSNRADALRDDAHIAEMFTIYLPFWAVWNRVAAWIIGKKKRTLRERETDWYKETKCVLDLHWNSPACDVAEFCVDAIQLEDRPLELSDPDIINSDGMVFEPVGSEEEPRRQAHRFFEEEVKKHSKIGVINPKQILFLRERLGIIYYPLWIARYSFHGKTYQLVIDGHSGDVLYGKVPGNPWHRAAVLILSIALGVICVVYGSAIVIKTTLVSCPDFSFIAILPIIFGIKVIKVGYSKYIHGEEIEIRTKNPLRPRKGLINALLEKPLSLEIDW